MKFSHATAPSLALLLGVATTSMMGLTGWSPGAHAQSAAAPATTVPPAATPVVPPAATTTAPAELAAPTAAAAMPAMA